MAKKDDEIAATATPQSPPTRRRMTALDYAVMKPAESDATTSVADAIVSVIPAVSREDIDKFRAQLAGMDPPMHKALAEGALTPEQVGIKTVLPNKVTTALSNVTYQAREATDLRTHQETLARIGASGAAKAEIVKPAAWVVAIVVVGFFSWLFGRTGVDGGAPPNSTTPTDAGVQSTVEVGGQREQTAQPVQQADAVAQLSVRLAEVEQQRDQLVQQLTELSLASLAPETEVGALSAQLKSEEPSARKAAATGLFSIDDPRGGQALMDFYWSHPSEATDVEDAGRYLNKVWSSNKQLGVDFAIRLLAVNNAADSQRAFNTIDNIGTGASTDFEVWLLRPLQDLALRSEDTLVRARAKVLLENRVRYTEATGINR